MTTIMKTCKRCKINKCISNFCRSSSTKDNYNIYCKDCIHLYITNYQKTEKGKEKIKKANQKYYLNNFSKVILSRLKSRATKNNLEFNLTEDYINSLITKECPIMKIPIGVRLNEEGHRIKLDSISFDRIDNKKGYVIGNVWAISNIANRIKSDSNTEQMIKFAKWVLNTYNEDGSFKNSL